MYTTEATEVALEFLRWEYCFVNLSVALVGNNFLHLGLRFVHGCPSKVRRYERWITTGQQTAAATIHEIRRSWLHFGAYIVQRFQMNERLIIGVGGYDGSRHRHTAHTGICWWSLCRLWNSKKQRKYIGNIRSSLNVSVANQQKGEKKEVRGCTKFVN